MNLELYGVDAFTRERFRGNPAAVCLLTSPMADDWMQGVAAEMNLSETAFVEPRGTAWGLRWFTPTAEVDLCGHATLAAAHILWETARVAPLEAIRFHSRVSGLLTCERSGDWISMNFPVRPAAVDAGPAGLSEALGVIPRWIGRTPDDLFCELDDESVVRCLRPDIDALARLPVRGVIVTARGTGDWDCVSRFFAPSVGVREDPVTGSAHCSLAPYWSERLGRRELRAWQASARGGEVRTRWDGDRVHLSGQALTAWDGRWH